MTREDAYEFIRLYKQFQATGLKIVDFDAYNTEVQLNDGRRVWQSDWYAAKVIEADAN